ncbi:tripeptide aminopeptidase [Marinococcus luteus]|uniref:Tripeptide aminopeptidase n=1 Tax=Marinococcus luteus TaxID=1122204 RepID=A0A1H2RRW6_9BACI|nr:M20/M25/M40 family metallo-hydrolase [Marinococcus luteus]SDW22222.1 tripeptide aminopeptidase [Marinococcus luteus]
MANQERLIQEFIELVQIDSETKHEAKIADVIKRKFQELGLETKEDNAKALTGHGAGNLICTLKGTDGTKPVIYFTSHMDTVEPGKGIEPEVQDEYIVSGGETILGADDKAGIAAMLEMVKVLQEEDEPYGDIQFIITVGEESGLVGAKNLDTGLVHADMGYALDSDGPVGTLVTSAPYQTKMHATIYGKKAHAGVEPEKGISAISVASKAVTKMPLGRIDEETTANIGSFAGGTQTNVVCDEVVISAEARSFKPDKLSRQVAAMREAFEEAAGEMGAEASIDIQPMYEGYVLAESDDVVQRAVQAAKRIDVEPRTVQSGGGSDANVISGYGIPTINLGVGYENIHTTEERLLIKEFVKVPAFMAAIVTGPAEDA